MVLCVYGTGLYGRTDEVPGVFYVSTTFSHFYFLPFYPLESFLVLDPGILPRSYLQGNINQGHDTSSSFDGLLTHRSSFTGVPIGWHYKSILWVYVRVIATMTAIIAFGIWVNASNDKAAYDEECNNHQGAAGGQINDHHYMYYYEQHDCLHDPTMRYWISLACLVTSPFLACLLVGCGRKASHERASALARMIAAKCKVPNGLSVDIQRLVDQHYGRVSHMMVPTTEDHDNKCHVDNDDDTESCTEEGDDMEIGESDHHEGGTKERAQKECDPPSDDNVVHDKPGIIPNAV